MTKTQEEIDAMSSEDYKAYIMSLESETEEEAEVETSKGDETVDDAETEGESPKPEYADKTDDDQKSENASKDPFEGKSVEELKEIKENVDSFKGQKESEREELIRQIQEANRQISKLGNEVSELKKRPTEPEVDPIQKIIEEGDYDPKDASAIREMIRIETKRINEESIREKQRQQEALQEQNRQSNAMILDSIEKEYDQDTVSAFEKFAIEQSKTSPNIIFEDGQWAFKTFNKFITQTIKQGRTQTENAQKSSDDVDRRKKKAVTVGAKGYASGSSKTQKTIEDMSSEEYRTFVENGGLGI